MSLRQSKTSTVWDNNPAQKKTKNFLVHNIQVKVGLF